MVEAAPGCSGWGHRWWCRHGPERGAQAGRFTALAQTLHGEGHGRKLGLTVVAEGVETQAELAFLRSIECDQAQGFLICGAVSCTDFETLLLEDSSWPTCN